jgi:hypothetical protein
MGFITNKNVDYINENWDQLKCSPIAPFLQMVGLAPGNSKDTANSCKSSEFNSMFNSGMLGHTKNLNMMNKSMNLVNGQLNSFRTVIANMQQQAFKDLSMVTSKLFEVYVKIGNIFMVIVQHLVRMLKIMRYSVDTMANLMKVFIALINIIRLPINFVARLMKKPKIKKIKVKKIKI